MTEQINNIIKMTESKLFTFSEVKYLLDDKSDSIKKIGVSRCMFNFKIKEDGYCM